MSIFSDVSSDLSGIVGGAIDSFINDKLNDFSSEYLNSLSMSFTDGVFSFNTDTSSVEIKDLQAESWRLQLKSRFEAMFVLPSMMITKDNEVMKLMKTFCISAPVPSQQMAVNTQLLADTKRVYVTSKNTDNGTFTFYDGGVLHKLFLEWQNKTFNSKHGAIAYYPDDYKADIVIMVQSPDRKKYVKSYLLRGCYPLNVGDLIYSNSSTNELQQFDTTMNIDSIKPLNTTFSKASSEIIYDDLYGKSADDLIGLFKSYFMRKGLSILSGYKYEIEGFVNNGVSTFRRNIGF